VTQPIVNEVELGAVEHRANAAASIVAGDDYVLHSKYIDRVLQHGKAIQIGMDDHVRDVSMHEEFARRQSNDFVCRNAAVGTPYPQIGRRLLFPQALEEAGIALDSAFGPISVVLQQTLECRHDVQRTRRYVVLSGNSDRRVPAYVCQGPRAPDNRYGIVRN
jgi:hypothetical protein